MLIRAGIFVVGVIVVVVGWMVVVGVGVISFSEDRLSLTEVECLRVGFWLVGSDIFDFSGVFVVMVVEMKMDDLELEVGDVVRIAWSWVNSKLYFCEV